MTNYSYCRGRSFEYQRARHYREEGCLVLRSAGSHGDFDLTIIRPRGLVLLLQCKRTNIRSVGMRMCREFKANPPLPAGYYEQRMEVLVKGGEMIVETIPAVTQHIDVDVSGNTITGP